MWFILRAHLSETTVVVMISMNHVRDSRIYERVRDT